MWENIYSICYRNNALLTAKEYGLYNHGLQCVNAYNPVGNPALRLELVCAQGGAGPLELQPGLVCTRVGNCGNAPKPRGPSQGVKLRLS